MKKLKCVYMSCKITVYKFDWSLQLTSHNDEEEEGDDDVEEEEEEEEEVEEEEPAVSCSTTMRW